MSLALEILRTVTLAAVAPLSFAATDVAPPSLTPSTAVAASASPAGVVHLPAAFSIAAGSPRAAASPLGASPRASAPHAAAFSTAGASPGAAASSLGAASPRAAASSPGAFPRAAAAAIRSPAAPVNLLLITLDTTRADHLGCYGWRGAATPTLDRIARSGTLFENALSPAPLTFPSHCSILTGLVPRRHGVRDNAMFRLGPRHPTLASKLAARGYTTAAVVGAAVLDRSTGIARGFATYDDAVRIRRRSEFNFEERAAAQVTDAGRSLLASLPSPFFLWIHYYDPHFPYVPPSPYRERHRADPYDGEIAYMDAEIGRLLEGLGDRGLTRSTVIAIAGDHGESLGEHGEPRHDVFLYQATQHVPLVLAGPGVASGRRITERVGLVDLLPTLLELLRAPPLSGLDGVTLTSLLEPAPSGGLSSSPHDGRSASGGPRGTTSPERVFEMESFFPAYAYDWAPPLGLVAGRWKYIAAPRAELYDLAADPGEGKNLLSGESSVRSPAAVTRATRETAARLAAELRARYGNDEAARGFGMPEAAGGASSHAPARAPESGARSSPGRGESGRAPASAEEAEQRERLTSLGYVGGSVAPGSPPRPGAHRDPKDGIAILRDLDRANGLLQSGRPSEAVPILEALASRDPRNFPVLAILGAACLQAGNHDRAIAVHRSTLLLRPDYELAHANLAGALRAKAASLDGASPGVPGTGPPQPRAASLRDEAARELEETLRLRPRDSESYLAYAQLELERRRPAAARDVLARAVKESAGDPDIYLLLGRVEASLGHADAARAAFRRVLDLDARSAAAHEGLGKLAYAAGDARAAEAHYARALALAPDPATAKTLGAIRLDALDDKEGARSAFRRALELAPNAADAGEIRAILRGLDAPSEDSGTRAPRGR